MLCEGVMLYMMLVTVFGNKLNKKRFFLLLGWGKKPAVAAMHLINFLPFFLYKGPAIPIVAISAGIAHKQYGTNY